MNIGHARADGPAIRLGPSATARNPESRLGAGAIAHPPILCNVMAPVPDPIHSTRVSDDHGRSVWWGFGDATWAVAGGFTASVIAYQIVVAVRYPHLADGKSPTADALDSAINGLAQFATMALLVWLTVGRRGQGLRHELGLRLRIQEIYWIAIGMGAAITLGIAQWPIAKLWDNGHHGKQNIGEQVRDSSSIARVLLFFVVVIIAPVVEETIFRGVVLRSALRRMRAPVAVLVSGVSFAAIHLGDIATFPSLPALIMLGTGSAILAVRTGELGRSIYLHMGFNLMGFIALVTT